jgi:dephospho-CoA kinase
VATSPYVVALTGGIGSGKSTIAIEFAAHGIECIDADEIARRQSAKGGAALPGLIAAFGSGILDASGGLDRAAMRKLAFADDAARRRLEAVLHPLIGIETEAAIARARSPYVLWVVPLLFEARSGGKPRYDRALVVDCDEETQIARVMKRSALSRDEVLAIMAHQVTRKERLALADEVIVNDGDLEALKAAVTRLHEKFIALAIDKSNERL